MTPKKINDNKLMRMFDKGCEQPEMAKVFGVTRQAISKRLLELRGPITKIAMVREPQKIANNSFNALQQLTEINRKSLEMLERAEETPEFALKCIREVRNQIRLAAEIQVHLFSIQEAQKFMMIVKEALKEASPDGYKEFMRRIASERALSTIIRSS